MFNTWITSFQDKNYTKNKAAVAPDVQSYKYLILRLWSSAQVQRDHEVHKTRSTHNRFVLDLDVLPTEQNTDLSIWVSPGSWFSLKVMNQHIWKIDKLHTWCFYVQTPPHIISNLILMIQNVRNIYFSFQPLRSEKSSEIRTCDFHTLFFKTSYILLKISGSNFSLLILTNHSSTHTGESKRPHP